MNFNGINSDKHTVSEEFQTIFLTVSQSPVLNSFMIILHFAKPHYTYQIKFKCS